MGWDAQVISSPPLLHRIFKFHLLLLIRNTLLYRIEVTLLTLEYLFNDHDGRLIFQGKSLFSVMKQKSYVVLCSKVVAR